MPGLHNPENHFENYEHLTHLTRSDEALHTIKKVASLVKPLMRKRGWIVGTLCEFLPSEANLLGLNIDHGRKICLRLRYPGDPTQFLPYDNVVDTMVHELSHIVWGPHDQNFNNLWDELRGEVQSLLAKGYTGEGFMGKGKAVGGRKMPVQEAQRLARKRAQEQFERTRGGPQRLGGRTARPTAGTDMRKVIADAAERRAKINQGCPTERGDIARVEQTYGRQGTRTRAEENDAENDGISDALIDLLTNDQERRLNGLPPLGTSARDPIPVDNLRPTTNNTRRPPSGQTPNRTTPQPRPVPENRPRQPTRPVRPIPVPRPNPPPTQRPTPPAQRPLGTNGRPVSRLVTEAENNRRSGTATPTRTPPTRTTPTATPRPTLAAPVNNGGGSAGGDWACPACTLINSVHMPKCEICECPRTAIERIANARAGGGAAPTPPRPAPPAVSRTGGRVGGGNSGGGSRAGSGAGVHRGGGLGWVCHRCDTFMENEWWTCSNCGTMKLASGSGGSGWRDV